MKNALLFGRAGSRSVGRADHQMITTQPKASLLVTETALSNTPHQVGG